MANIDKLLSSKFDTTLYEFNEEQRMQIMEFRRTFPATFAELTKALIDELDVYGKDYLKEYHINTMYGVNSLVLSEKDNDNKLIHKWADAVSIEISNFYKRINFVDCIPTNSLIRKWLFKFPAYVLNGKDINNEFSRALNTPVIVIIDDLASGHIALRICKA